MYLDKWFLLLKWNCTAKLQQYKKISVCAVNISMMIAEYIAPYPKFVMLLWASKLHSKTNFGRERETMIFFLLTKCSTSSSWNSLLTFNTNTLCSMTLIEFYDMGWIKYTDHKINISTNLSWDPNKKLAKIKEKQRFRMSKCSTILL